MSETPAGKAKEPAPDPPSQAGSPASQDANQTVLLPKGDSGEANPLLHEQDAAMGQALATLPNYEIEGKLGEGGMGAVYRARQRTLDRAVAIKVLPQQLSRDAKYAARLHREARVLAKINHPHVIACYDVGEHQGILYVVMEFVAGESLYHTLSKRGSLPLSEALFYLKQAVLGLDHANAVGIVHRDIKPENLLLAKGLAAGTTARLPSGYSLKIADLGLAAYTEENSQNTRLTVEGSAVGSPHYMSPEQTLGEREIDFRTDIYALGATLYHMLTGKTPYQGTSVAAVLAKKLSSSIPDPRAEHPELPPGVSLLIQKMTARKKEDRYAAYGELLSDIEALEAQRPLAAELLSESKASLALLPETRQALHGQAEPASGKGRSSGRPDSTATPSGPTTRSPDKPKRVQFSVMGAPGLAVPVLLALMALLGLYLVTRSKPSESVAVPKTAPKSGPQPVVPPPSNPAETVLEPGTVKRPPEAGTKIFEAQELIEEHSIKGWTYKGDPKKFGFQDGCLFLIGIGSNWVDAERELPASQYTLRVAMELYGEVERCEFRLGLGGPAYVACGLRFEKKLSAYVEKRNSANSEMLELLAERGDLSGDDRHEFRANVDGNQASFFLGGKFLRSVELYTAPDSSARLALAARNGTARFLKIEIEPPRGAAK